MTHTPKSATGETGVEVATRLRVERDHVNRKDDYVDTGELLQYVDSLETALRGYGVDVDAIELENQEA